jgi:hypothetical protein
MHAVEPEDTTAKPEPSIRSFWKVDGMTSYEFDDYDITSIVSKLVHAGATQITLHKFVVDDNEPRIEEPVIGPTGGQEVLVRGVVVPNASES